MAIIKKKSLKLFLRLEGVGCLWILPQVSLVIMLKHCSDWFHWPVPQILVFLQLTETAWTGVTVWLFFDLPVHCWSTFSICLCLFIYLNFSVCVCVCVCVCACACAHAHTCFHFVYGWISHVKPFPPFSFSSFHLSHSDSLSFRWSYYNPGNLRLDDDTIEVNEAN